MKFLLKARIRLDTEAIHYISLFEKLTKAHVVDCIPLDNKITFVVKEGHAGIAIGKKGMNVKTLTEKFNKKIEIIEFSKDPIKFLIKLFKPIEIKNPYLSEDQDGNKILNATITKTRMLAKVKMKRAEEFIKKYYNIDEIKFN